MIRDILTFDARYRQLRSDFVMGKITGVDFVTEQNPKKQPRLLQSKDASENKERRSRAPK